ncbi:MAG TPA: PhzF family phenazine biosynthesis protein [Candidatus Acidoferrales bacterium]|nr:PhzF family phenazine biosynthesis protein [Candidatus Acidoferrales bacterium]
MLRNRAYLVLDVFTDTRLAGNPLAIFPDGDGIGDDEMQKIAAEFNLSETVFLLPPATRRAAGRARIFTPRRELDFAGHPTIGSAYVLRQQGESSSSFFIEERVGLVHVDVDAVSEKTPMFWLTTPPIAFYETLDRPACAALLGLPEADLAPAAPPQFVSAGNPFLFVQLRSPDAVDRAELQPSLLSKAAGSVDSVGTFVFARKYPESELSFDVYARMFAPQTGIAEDPATGSATGPLAAYMLRYGELPSRDLEFVSEQGVKMGRRSVLYVRVSHRGGDAAIRVGGTVAVVAEGTFFLSDR